MSLNEHSQNNDFPGNQVQESQPDYEKAEMDLLRAGLARTHTERFLFATRLYKIQKTLDKAKIVYKPDTLKI